MCAVVLGFGLSALQAQTYKIGDYLVRSVPNNFVDIEGIGTDITSDLNVSAVWESYYKVSTKEFTLPFNFRWFNKNFNKFKVTSIGQTVMGTHSVNFWAAELTSGIYVYEMTAALANGETVKMSRKMTLNK